MKSLVLFLLIIHLAFGQEKLTINCGFQQPEATLITNVLKSIFHEANIGLTVQILPNKRSLVNANNGTNDGDATRIWNINKYYPNLVRVPLRTHHIDIVALTNKKHHIKSFEDLKPFNVGVVRGMKITEVKVAAIKPQSLSKISDYGQLLRMLKTGRIDVIITDKTSLLNEIKKRRITSLFLVKKPLLVLPLYIHLHKKNQHFIPRLTKAIETLNKTNTLTKIENTFFNDLEKETRHLVKLIE